MLIRVDSLLKKTGHPSFNLKKESGLPIVQWQGFCSENGVHFLEIRVCCVQGEYDAIKSSTECSSEYPSLAAFLGLCLLLTSIDNGFIYSPCPAMSGLRNLWLQHRKKKSICHMCYQSVFKYTYTCVYLYLFINYLKRFFN